MNTIENTQLSTEIARMDEEYEPLSVIEKKMIAYSLITGTVLLGMLLFISYTFFPSGH